MRVDLTNQVFGRLAVIEIAGRYRHREILWKCQCLCGNFTEVTTNTLRSGNTSSCGCWERRTHGGSKTRAYEIWMNMRYRCENPNRSHYDRYGGRGIKVCDHWQEFRNFLTDMGQPPTEKHTIDRINNDGNYEPGNCRWATMAEQSENRSQTRVLEFRGLSLSIGKWARRLGVSSGMIRHRLDRLGWSVEKSLSTPSKKSQRRQTHDTGGRA